MSRRTFIEWCDYTWNPWRGCTKVSPGCTHCYAEKLVTTRLRGEWGKGKPRARGSEAILHAPHLWNKRPWTWICDVCGRASDRQFDHSCTGRKEDACHTDNVTWHRARVFLGSLMDIFDDEVDPAWLAMALHTVSLCPNIDFLLVTKRPELFAERTFRALDFFRMGCFMDAYKWLKEWREGKAPHNVWMITSTENQAMADKRIPELLRIPAVVHGLSCEPLLGPISINPSVLALLQWVIVGGESGSGARPMNVEWMSEIQRQCKVAGIAYFAKQLGSFPATENANLHDWPEGTKIKVCFGYTQAAGGRALLKDKKGGEPSEWPEEMRVRQWPEVHR